MKHWTHYLPEAGKPLTKIGDTILALEEEIRLFEIKIKRIQEDINEKERLLKIMTREDWEEREVTMAKHEASVFNRL